MLAISCVCVRVLPHVALSASGYVACVRLPRAQLLAMEVLEPMEAAPAAPVASAAPAPKYNSTSSLYIDSTITRPCIDEIIFCVSIVIHDRIEEGACAARDA